ncbi:hypothetical protein [Deinococcus sp. QL22]|uniref:hypothetical protein n=1 Tax=Deinococcus sp. QL22 TaxID=2939437 RepID=UPI00201838D7|nr:hypothetical protein [Deinococcus sp. QL22]UQN06268.1 hypothetical protein M1R55_15630 [Deinococcus sp. QL22]
MPAPTIAKPELLTGIFMNTKFRETFKPPTGTTATTAAVTRSVSGAVYPRPTR